jgi:hypothetical protein
LIDIAVLLFGNEQASEKSGAFDFTAIVSKAEPSRHTDSAGETSPAGRTRTSSREVFDVDA